MSIFVDNLKKVGQNVSQPMGFAHSISSRAKGRNILIVGFMKAADANLAETAAKAGVDAIILTGDAKTRKWSLKTLSDSLGDLPVGFEVSAQENKAQENDQFVDFNFLDDIKLPASCIQDTDKSNVLTIDINWTDSFIRSLEPLPLDALIIDLRGEESFTIELAISCQRVSLLTQKPLIAYLDPSWGVEFMPVLRDLGIKALAVDVSESAKSGVLAQLCDSARMLEPKKKKPERRDAMLPSPAPAASSHIDEDEEDD
ncbi:MAG: hypothetical protein EXR50_08675 [Dehalococcoidia bacterium]|nr:hypothetical protein [Dehalococcoidia bacterium]